MPFFKKSLAGPGYVVLNIIRVMNIIVLMACVAASFVMLVKTFVVSKFFFFDAVSHVITGILSILLIITELPIFRRYVANNWPLLSPSSGFVTLGIVMIILGVSILGNLNKEATSEDSIGTAFWRIVIASGILACIVGLVNIFASFMFRNKSLGITARQVRMHGKLADQKVYIPPSGSVSNYSPQLSAKPTMSSRRRSFIQVRRSTTLPSYHPSSKYSPPQQQGPIRNISAPIGSGAGPSMTENGRGPPTVNYSLPGGGNPFMEKGRDEEEADCVPVVNGIQRPDLAHHPALQGGRF